MKNSDSIEQRDIHFDLAGCDLKRWNNNDICRSHLFNAMSFMFPEGEKFFIESVRHYRDRITDPKLLKDVQSFIGQEAMHGREHRVYNAALGKAGYDSARLEKRTISQINFTRRMLPPKARLAVTIALEHFTAIMADAMLSCDRVFENADPRMTALWRWHAIEETEHKAVAFDVYQTIAPGFFGWLRRCTIMLSTSLVFWTHNLMNYFYLTRQDGINFWKAAWLYFKLGFINPGTLRHIQIPWLMYFSPRFHPWQHDNRHHVERWKNAYAASGNPP